MVLGFQIRNCVTTITWKSDSLNVIQKAQITYRVHQGSKSIAKSSWLVVVIIVERGKQKVMNHFLNKPKREMQLIILLLTLPKLKMKISFLKHLKLKPIFWSYHYFTHFLFLQVLHKMQHTFCSLWSLFELNLYHIFQSEKGNSDPGNGSRLRRLDPLQKQTPMQPVNDMRVLWK